MKKLVALGLLVATVTFAGTAFADVGTALQLKELMQWSNQAADAAKAAAQQKAQTAGPGAQSTNPVPPYEEFPFGIRDGAGRNVVIPGSH